MLTARTSRWSRRSSRDRSHERRRAVPRRELVPLGGQRRGASRKRGGRPPRRRAVPRRELVPLGGQRRGASRKRGGRPPRRRAVPRRELVPLGGQRRGASRKRGGRPPRRRAVPRRELVPLGGSAAAQAASVGVVLRVAGPSQDANSSAASSHTLPCAAHACRPPSMLADAPFGPGLRPARRDVPGGSAAASAASVGVP